MARDALLAQIHIAKKELALDDDTYRDVLERVANVRSAKDLSEDQRRAVLAEFRARGWKGRKGRKGSSKPYVRKVFAVWGELKRAGVWREEDPASLRRFVKKMTGCDDPEWLSYAQASVVIEALKKMGGRANVN